MSEFPIFKFAVSDRGLFFEAIALWLKYSYEVSELDLEIEEAGRSVLLQLPEEPEVKIGFVLYRTDDVFEDSSLPAFDKSMYPRNVFVDQDYIMDPLKEDLIFGYQLQHGHKVLLEELNLLGGNPTRFMESELTRRRLRQFNRWCIVTNLRRSNDIIRFIGVYDDGTKMSHTINKSYAWIVKKGS